MPYMLTRIHVDDYDAWKPVFDSDPPSARTKAKGHRILRSLEDPDQLFIQVEFNSPGDAIAARDRLVASGVLDRVTLEAGPTLAEEAESVTY